ncbi:hypothetical protein M8818_005086 [Zalaria obscura]|uniref:Uncharacterized protein n=1 Tax=Zalaria obscura TaxID=2024903 RepID=A0ACC3S9P5_9PEZI
MATHTRKRHIQPNKITSYFERKAGDSNGANATGANTTSRLSPALPDHIQSSLINVGMRVRKSVPEGYKTHKTLNIDVENHQPVEAQLSGPATSSQGFVFEPARELAPFCGLHKIGGLATAPASSPYASSQDSVPGLSWSQASVASMASVATIPTSWPAPDNQKKRSYDDEIEEELDAYFEREDAVLGAPTSRPIAQPRGRAKGLVSMNGAEPVSTVPGDFDDGDVGFLQPMDTDV